MTTIDYGPDVATLRAQLAEARAKVARAESAHEGAMGAFTLANEMLREAEAEHDSLRADLARVTGERDEARAAARARGVWCPTCRALVHSDDEGTCVTCGDGGTLVVEEMADTLDRIAEIANATECYEVGEVVGHVQSLVEERDEARASLARVTPSAEVRATLAHALRLLSVSENSASDDATPGDVAYAWLASLPGGDS